MNRHDAITFYFNLGLQYKDILTCLAHNHGMIVSYRHLKRLLKGQGLYRKKYFSPLITILKFVMKEVRHAGQMQGHKWLHLKCVQNKLVVTQEVVRLILSLLVPENVRQRSKRRLQRRRYCTQGSNWVWHVDSYDKLKPYGICINGCVDGFSRNIIWLEAYTTNSDPKVIASYYVQAVEEHGGAPTKMRSDLGTENSSIECMQIFLRSNHQDRHAAHQSFMKGASKTNQRIEAWWSILRRQNAQYYMNMFGHLKDEGMFSGDFLDKSLIQFCFLKLIQVCIPGHGLKIKLTNILLPSGHRNICRTLVDRGCSLIL